MVEIATALGRNGLQDWLIQRLSAVLLGIYSLILVGYCCFHPNLSYAEWQQFFSSPFMKYSSVLVLLSLLAHAWIGFWTISTDYIKILSLRLSTQILVILGLFFCFVWGLHILGKL